MCQQSDTFIQNHQNNVEFKIMLIKWTTFELNNSSLYSVLLYGDKTKDLIQNAALILRYKGVSPPVKDNTLNLLLITFLYIT